MDAVLQVAVLHLCTADGSILQITILQIAVLQTADYKMLYFMNIVHSATGTIPGATLYFTKQPYNAQWGNMKLDEHSLLTLMALSF